MDTATKTGMDAAKTASKRVVHKTAEGTGDLIGNLAFYILQLFFYSYGNISQLIKLLQQASQEKRRKQTK